MTIPDEEVAQVRAATDIVALIGEHVALRQQGRRWVGLCPFHAERTPSFSVNAQDGFYYCFGCQASGDAITFVRDIDRLDFVDAVRLLAERAGVTLHESAQSSAEHGRRTELLDAMGKAVTWYHERLLTAPDAGRARDYLRSRGYDGETVRQFRLGWAPDDWDALCQALRLPDQVAVDAGLGFVNRRGRLQDAFRGRVLFPVFDPAGRPIAIGGRILPPPGEGDRAGVGVAPDGDGRATAHGTGRHRSTRTAPERREPKYKNSPETLIYSKRRVLYGLNWAKKDIIATGEVVVCEGYTDVIACFLAGLPRAVATCGTALGEEHFRLLANFGRRVVLAYDGDQAGQAAIARVYEWERRHEIDVRVAALPAGGDPADLARSDPDALRAAVSGAVPFLQFRVDRMLGGSDLSTAEGRARAAYAALAAVAEHPDGLVRDQYVMRIADRTRFDPDRLRDRLAGVLRGELPIAGSTGGHRPTLGSSRDAVDDGPEIAGDRQGASRRPGATGVPGGDARRPSRRSVAPGRGSRPGLEALRLAVHRPELVADRLEAVLFGDELQRRAFLVLASSDDLAHAVRAAEGDPEVADLLRRLAVEEPLAPDDPRADPADAVVAQLLRDASRRVLGDRQAELRATSGDLAAVVAEAAAVRGWVGDLDDPSRCREASDRLLAWLLGARQEGR